MSWTLDSTSVTLDSSQVTLDGALTPAPAPITSTVMGYRQSRIEISIQVASLDGIFYGRYPHGDKPIGATPVDATWAPAASNTDSSAVTAGEVTGYQMGLRTTGVAGTYPILLELSNPYGASALLAGILPTLATGTYYAAIQSLGPTNSAWTSEVSFAVP